MYGKVVNLKFANMEEAKLAASFFTENIASKISALKIIGFNYVNNTYKRRRKYRQSIKKIQTKI